MEVLLRIRGTEAGGQPDNSAEGEAADADSAGTVKDWKKDIEDMLDAIQDGPSDDGGAAEFLSLNQKNKIPLHQPQNQAVEN